MSIEYIGPFEDYYSLLVDGIFVPYITARKEGESWCLSLDNRFALPDLTEDDINKWLWFIANAMAIAAGYTCFGENAKRRNPFSSRAIGLSTYDMESLQSENE